MEKDYRLFVKNLPINISQDKIQELFGKYATITKIDLKEKKDLDNKIHKFAFINITTSDKNLQTCFCELNGERIDGFQINVELAKESFLERIKRERTESKVKSLAPHVPIQDECFKPDVFNNTASKAKRKTFSDADFLSNDYKNEPFEPIESKRKHSKHIQEELDISNQALHLQAGSDQENSTLKISKVTNEFIKPKKQIFFDEDGLESERIMQEINFKKQSVISSNKDYNQATSEIVIKPTLITESEKKRLTSLKQKKQAFKSQEQVIRNALKCVDKNQCNNKIVFSDNIDSEITTTEKNAPKKNTLFDSDDEDEEKINWDEAEIDAKAQLKSKLLKLQTSIGNDKRFVLDERFVDDENDKIISKENHTDDTQKMEDEKKWQLDILGNVLGKSIKSPTADPNEAIKKKNKMIRYDPTASNHEAYEVKIEKSKKEKPVKKKVKLSSNEVEVESVIPTSKEIFYDVSDKLVESLKQNEGFSLLKAFGRSPSETDNGNNNVKMEKEESKESFQFNFSAKNPFKYDSSDDEDGNEESNNKNSSISETATNNKFSRSNDDRLFFIHNDPRFEEAKQFFKNQAAQEKCDFKNRRRELKEIVRSKIRNNLKKKVPWNRRKVRKIQKK